MEYASNWESKKRRIYAQTRRCCWCFVSPASIVHHVKYTRSPGRRVVGLLFKQDFDRSNVGYEIGGWDVFPVCDRCHENSYGASQSPHSLHYTGTPNPKWIKVENRIKNHIVLNHNTGVVVWRLRLTWLVATNQFAFFVLVGAAIAFVASGLTKLFGG